jgi:hypothetical protein
LSQHGLLFCQEDGSSRSLRNILTFFQLTRRHIPEDFNLQAVFKRQLWVKLHAKVPWTNRVISINIGLKTRWGHA